MVVRDPNDTEKRAIAAAKQAIAEMEPRFDIGTQIKTENGATYRGTKAFGHGRLARPAHGGLWYDE